MNADPQDSCEVKQLLNFFDTACLLLFAQLLVRGVCSWCSSVCPWSGWWLGTQLWKILLAASCLASSRLLLITNTKLFCTVFHVVRKFHIGSQNNYWMEQMSVFSFIFYIYNIYGPETRQTVFPEVGTLAFFHSFAPIVLHISRQNGNALS